MIRVKRKFTDTSQFDNGILPWGKALATSLQWLYDDDEFEDDSLSEAEYNRNILYCMDGVLPIYDFMSLVTDVIFLAFQDFGVPNIKNYINLLQDFETRKWGDKLHLQYDGEYMILGKVSIFTTEVILWAAYLYCNIRKELDSNKERAIRADRLLYKLYARQTRLKPELVKDTFLMKHFNKTAVAFLKHIPTQGKDYKEEGTHSDPKSVNMEGSVIDKISANNIRYYYEGWRNGKHGSICQTNGIYRFVEMARGKSGILDDVKRKEEDNPIVAKGIVAYWLQFNSRMDTVIKRLTKYNCEIPKDIREQFANYTQIRFEQFRQEHRDDPNTCDWDWEYEFYVNTIIPHEIAFNKESEALFDYISDSDIELVRGVMNNYIEYLKIICAEKGYKVNEEESEAVTSQTPQMPQAPKGSGQDVFVEEKEWDDTYDEVFKDGLNPRQIFYKLENMTYPRVTDNYPRIFVFFRVLLYLGWIENHQKNFLKWANCHWKLNWKHNHNFKFSNNIQKEFRDTDIADWDDNTCNGSDIGNAYRSLAKKVLDELAEKVNGGKIVDRITFYEEGVKSRINDGKKLAYPF